MATEVSKSNFKAHALKIFRKVEAAGKPVIVTDQGQPTLIVQKYKRTAGSLKDKLKESVLSYDAPFGPGGDDILGSIGVTTDLDRWLSEVWGLDGVDEKIQSEAHAWVWYLRSWVGGLVSQLRSDAEGGRSGCSRERRIPSKLRLRARAEDVFALVKHCKAGGNQ